MRPLAVLATVLMSAAATAAGAQIPLRGPLPYAAPTRHAPLSTKIQPTSALAGRGDAGPC